MEGLIINHNKRPLTPKSIRASHIIIIIIIIEGLSLLQSIHTHYENY